MCTYIQIINSLLGQLFNMSTKEIFENLELFLKLKPNSIFLKDTLIIRVYIFGYNFKTIKIILS